MGSLWRKEMGDIQAGGKVSGADMEENKWDVIVAGAGMAGLLTAYYLKEQGKKVLVLEADRVASGQTERTTAKITSQHGLKYYNLIRTVGIKKARQYADANQNAVKEYERLIREKNISCDFENVTAFLYAFHDTKKLEQEYEASQKLGFDSYFTKETGLPFHVAGAVGFRNQAQFNPLKFAEYIASQLCIETGAKVTGVKGHRVITEKGQYTADNIVIATHYPVLNMPGFYFLRQHQERSCVLALSGCEKINNMYYGVDWNGISLRQSGEYLLLGGAGCRTGKNTEGGTYGILRDAAKQYFPEGKEEMSWSAQDCIPHDGIPFIGKYSIFKPYIYVITGFQKWGMTSSMAAANILSDRLLGRKNPWEKVFRPQRCNVRAGIKNLFTDVGESTKGLAKGAFHRPKETAENLQPGHGGIVMDGGKRASCYVDENGQLHKISARCPHMGCELTWNPDEKSWDCPCHGSRFDVDGKLLDNPSKKDGKHFGNGCSRNGK